MSYQITRRFQFCAGHRVYGHESKCAHPHGHNYVLLATFQAEGLDSVGRVIDFSVIKEVLGKWIDDHWDHGFILFAGDFELRKFFDPSPHKHFILDDNPTAENMAHYLLHRVCPMLFTLRGVRATKVVLWETENCYAEVAL